MWDVLFFPDDDDSKSQDKSEGERTDTPGITLLHKPA